MYSINFIVLTMVYGDILADTCVCVQTMSQIVVKYSVSVLERFFICLMDTFCIHC